MSGLEQAEIFRAVLEALPTGVYFVDRNKKIAFWNDGAERITGYLRQDVVGRACRDDILVQGTENGSVVCAPTCPVADTIHDGQPRNTMVYIRHRAGHRILVQVRTVPIRDGRGVIIGAAESFDELRMRTQNRRQGDRMIEACIDETTDVPNHESLQSTLEEMLASLTEQQQPCGLLLVRVDQLNEFKLAHGPDAADTMLRAVAQTLKNSLRGTDIVGRWDKETLLAILPECMPSPVEELSKRVQRIAGSVSIEWWGDQLSPTVSVAGATAQKGDSISTLMARAEECLEAVVTNPD